MIPKKKPTRTLGVDYGAARIGLSLSDEMKLIASPYKVLQSKKKMKETALELLKEIDLIEKERSCIIDGIVIGMPYKMNGAIGLQADEVLAFKEALQEESAIPLYLLDERLTTVQGERMLRETAMTRKKRSHVIDLVAATIILQTFLELPSPRNAEGRS